MIIGSIGLAMCIAFGEVAETAEADQLRLEVLAGAKIDDGELLDLVVPPETSNEAVDILVEFGGEPALLLLRPTSVRAHDFLLFEVGDDGIPREVEPAPSVTFRGDVIDPETGRVEGTAIASIEEGQLDATAFLDADDSRWMIEPASRFASSAPAETHFVYNTMDVQFLDDRRGGTIEPFTKRDRRQGGGPADTGDAICDLAIDCDFEYMGWAGGRTQTLRSIEKDCLELEAIWERDVGITYELTALVIRTTKAGDPYTGNQMDDLLYQVRDWWDDNLWFVRRDMVHLQSGDTDPQYTWFAYIDSICLTYYGCGALGITSETSKARRVARWARCLGHQFDGEWCDGDNDCYLLCSFMGRCGGDFTRFGSQSISRITSFRDSLYCLDTEGNAPTLPFYDDFEGSEINPDLWSFDTRAGVSTGGTFEPSGSQSLELQATGDNRWRRGEVRSHEMDLENASDLYLTMWVQQRDLDQGEILRVDYYAKNLWKRLGSVKATGGDQTMFLPYEWKLPNQSFHDRFRFRIYQRFGDTEGFWYIDDVRIDTQSLLGDYDDDAPTLDVDGVQAKLRDAPARCPVTLYVWFTPPGGSGPSLDPRPIATARTDASGNANFVVERGFPDTLDFAVLLQPVDGEASWVFESD